MSKHINIDSNKVFLSAANKAERDSSFELLRLVLMFLILIHHVIFIGLGLMQIESASGEIIIRPDDMLLFCIANCICIPAVNIFVLISGYFEIKPTMGKALSLIISMLFYTVAFTIPYLIYQKDFLHILSSLFILSHSPYWFIITYLFLMLFAPLLNLLFQTQNKKNISIFIIGLLIISIYFGFIWGDTTNRNGYTLFQFIMMYCIGRYIKVFDIHFPRQGVLILIYFACTTLCGLGMYYLFVSGYNTFARQLTFYNNPLIIISSITAFFLFRNIEFKSKLVNKLAESSLSIYLFSCSKFFWCFFYPAIPVFYKKTLCSGYVILGCIIAFSIATMAISIGINQIQIKFNKSVLNFLKKIFHIAG